MSNGQWKREANRPPRHDAKRTVHRSCHRSTVCISSLSILHTMESNDSTTLAELANQIATHARQAADVIEQISSEANDGSRARARLDSIATGIAESIMPVPKPADPHWASILADWHCAADACELLARHSDTSLAGDWATLQTEDEKFWASARDVMDLWLRNSQDSVELLNKDVIQAQGWIGKLTQGFRAIPTVYGVENMLSGILGDVHMLNALLNL